MTFLSISGVTKSFGTNVVVKGFDLDVQRGEFVSFLGPSGCGKTTVLRMIAGFEQPSTGRVIINGEEVTDLPPNKRRVGMVFQAYALFPNMNAFENVAFGLRIAGVPRAELEQRVNEMLDMISLKHLADRYPYQMSGGQQQRVALARALAPRPQVLLLDEPLSALDAKIRVSLRQEIRDIQKRLGITTIFVTHDQEEALSISDRIVVMSAGNIEQAGAPFDIYNRPATRFVATFVGQINSLNGLVSDKAKGTVTIDGQAVKVPGLPATLNSGDPISLTVRPEAVSLANGTERDVALDGTVAHVSFLGSVIRLKVNLGDNSVDLDTFNDPRTPPPVLGERVRVTLSSSDIFVLGA